MFRETAGSAHRARSANSKPTAQTSTGVVVPEDLGGFFTILWIFRFCFVVVLLSALLSHLLKRRVMQFTANQIKLLKRSTVPPPYFIRFA